MGREEYTRMYVGYYDRAMTGRHPLDAIRAACLRCMNCKRGGIKNCSDEDCPLWLYRPYQTKPYRLRTRRRTEEISGALVAAGNAKSGPKSDRPYQQIIQLKNPGTGDIRLRIKVEANKQGK